MFFLNVNEQLTLERPIFASFFQFKLLSALIGLYHAGL
jgi:hypothetical protein